MTPQAYFLLDAYFGPVLDGVMKTCQEIIEWFGRQAIAAHIGVTESAVKNAYHANKFPASWFAAMEALAGRPLPRECFAFKAVA